MDVDDVIEAYLAQVAARGQYACTIGLYEFDADERPSVVNVRGQWTARDGLRRLDVRIQRSNDALDPLLDAGQTVTISDVHTDLRVAPLLRDVQARDGRPALAMIPLMVRGQRIGLVILSSPRVHEWSDAELQPYQATAAQLATAIDSRKQQTLVFERGQRVAVLEERQRLARELHDSVTQLIFSMTLIAQSIAPAWQRSPEEGERRVNRLLQLSQAALAEMRALLFELREPLLIEKAALGGKGSDALPGLVRVQREGLAAAIQRYAMDVARDGLQVRVESRDLPWAGEATTPTRASLMCEEALYRIAQEALNNVVKHAGARHVSIELAPVEGAVRMRVRDDGCGFSPDAPRAAPSFGGIGLKTMRERVEALHGVLQTISAPGQGTTIEVILPWPVA